MNPRCSTRCTPQYRITGYAREDLANMAKTSFTYLGSEASFIPD